MTRVERVWMIPSVVEERGDLFVHEGDALPPWAVKEVDAMRENKKMDLDLEVVEVERKTRPGCNSSSTNPRCTCPVIYAETDGA